MNDEIQCFECKGFKHVAADCANKKKTFKKAMVATWDDTLMNRKMNHHTMKKNLHRLLRYSLPSLMSKIKKIILHVVKMHYNKKGF